MTLEVRCCCRPEKLLGLVVLPAGVRYPLRDGQWIRWSLRSPMKLEPPTREEAEQKAAAAVVELQVRRAYSGRESWLALSSEETAIETLRRLPQFVEFL